LLLNKYIYILYGKQGLYIFYTMNKVYIKNLNNIGQVFKNINLCMQSILLFVYTHVIIFKLMF